MNVPIGAGLVGYGYAGRSFHAYLLSLEPRIHLTAISSRSKERREAAEKDWQVKTYPSARGLYEDPHVDLIIVATPHNTHAELAIKGLRAGKHVVVDKIMCMNTKEADAMIQARDQTRRCLSVFHNRRWDGDFLTIKRILREGLLGELYYGEIANLSDRPSSGWRAEEAMCGGILYDWGAHFVDQALLLNGSRPTSVHCIVQSVKWDQDIGDNGMMTIQFENGSCVRVWVGQAAKLQRPHWMLLGTQGAFVKEGVDPQERAMCEGRIHLAQEDPNYYGRLTTMLGGLQHVSTVTTLRGDWTAYYRTLADHLLEGKELPVKPEQVREAITVFDAAKESAKTGQAVKL